MYSIVYTGQFKKSLKLCVKRGLDVTVLAKSSHHPTGKRIITRFV